MKKSYIFFIIFLLFFLIGLGIYFYNSNKRKEQNNFGSSQYSTTKVASNQTNNEIQAEKNKQNQNTTTQEKSTNEVAQNDNNSNTNNIDTPSETLISEFTTKIYTKDKERQNNITITCSSLNNTIVENGQTFSFCNTVGKATPSKGYEKADVFKDGEVIQALGGGNCQVSSTLYNAVLKIPDLKVTERHEHSNSVPYVSKGKDAAVSYGTYDFKFVNNTGSKIKITSSCDKNNVYAKIFKI